MADIDSVIANPQAPQIQSPLDAMTKAMTVQDLYLSSQNKQMQNRAQQEEFSDNEAVRSAIQNNTTIGKDGMPVIDRKSALADVTDNAPTKATALAQQFLQQDAASKQAKINAESERLGFIGKGLLGVTDQAGYDDFKQTYGAMGYDASKLPSSYDPQTVKTQIGRALNVKESLDATRADQELAIKAQQAKIDSAKLGMDVFKTYGAPLKKNADPNTDPSTLVPTSAPPDRQAKIFDEIDAAQNTAKSAPKILKAFDNAASKLHAADFVPGASNADQKALHALMGPTFKDVEGTVRQAAMDNMNKNTTPQFGDSAETIATKRAALIGYLQSKASAPTAKAFGVDLSKYKATSIDPRVLAGNYKAPPSGATKTWNGKTYKLIGDTWTAQPDQQTASK